MDRKSVQTTKFEMQNNILFIQNITHQTKLTAPCEADSPSASGEIRHMVWNPKVYNRNQTSLQLDPVLSE
jgi:hypothetical protein